VYARLNGCVSFERGADFSFRLFELFFEAFALVAKQDDEFEFRLGNFNCWTNALYL
jgi:hypothetical protein